MKVQGQQVFDAVFLRNMQKLSGIKTKRIKHDSSVQRIICGSNSFSRQSRSVFKTSSDKHVELGFIKEIFM